MSFDDTWQSIGHLDPGQWIPNWTAAKGYYGEDFEVLAVDAAAVVVRPPSARGPLTVPKKDFKAVWLVWSRYIAGSFARADMTEITRFSKYVISILRFIESKDAQAR